MKREFSRQIFRKKCQTSYFMKTCPVGAELFHADGRKDRKHGLNSRFSQFFEIA